LSPMLQLCWAIKEKIQSCD